MTATPDPAPGRSLPPFSRRSHLPAGTNIIAEALARRRGPLLDLTVGNPTLAGFPLDDRIVGALGVGAARPYRPAPFGLPAARLAVADELSAEGVAVPAERIVLTASTSEACAFLFELLCDPGDELLIPRPGYPLFEYLARLSGVRAVPYPLYYDGEWSIDPVGLSRALGPGVRAVVTVSPANPVGAFTREADLHRLAALGLPIISDEVFSPYPLEPAADCARSVLEEPGELAFRLGGLSKRAAMPGQKLGWIAVAGEDEAVGEALRRLELIADLRLSASTMVQEAVPHLLELGADRRRRIASRLAANLRLLRARFEGTAATVPRLEGGWYAPIRLPAVRDETEWTLGLLDRGVRVQPGWFYDFDGGPWIVCSLLAPEEDFAAGVAVLREELERPGGPGPPVKNASASPCPQDSGA